MHMTPNTRLFLIMIILMISAAYAVTVVKDPDVASAIAVGYVALLLTIIVVVDLGKKP